MAKEREIDDAQSIRDTGVMSPKTHLIFNPFFRAYYKINVDSYAEKWIFYSNLIL